VFKLSSFLEKRKEERKEKKRNPILITERLYLQDKRITEIVNLGQVEKGLITS
jgi:hypothetical protein